MDTLIDQDEQSHGLCTKITEVNLSVFVYRLFCTDFSAYAKSWGGVRGGGVRMKFLRGSKRRISLEPEGNTVLS